MDFNMSIAPLSGCVRGIVGEGMPLYKNPFEKGDLYIRIEVDFPENYFAPEAKLKVGITIQLRYSSLTKISYSILCHTLYYPYSL